MHRSLLFIIGRVWNMLNIDKLISRHNQPSSRRLEASPALHCSKRTLSVKEAFWSGNILHTYCRKRRRRRFMVHILAYFTPSTSFLWGRFDMMKDKRCVDCIWYNSGTPTTTNWWHASISFPGKFYSVIVIMSEWVHSTYEISWYDTPKNNSL